MRRGESVIQKEKDDIRASFLEGNIKNVLLDTKQTRFWLNEEMELITHRFPTSCHLQIGFSFF